MKNYEMIVGKIKDTLRKLKCTKTSMFMSKGGMIMERDIFEEVRKFLGLDFISDMREQQIRVCTALKVMDLSCYSDKQIQDLKNYINQ